MLLIRGDVDNLERRAAVYGRLLDQTFIVRYVTDSLEDMKKRRPAEELLRKVGATPEPVDEGGKMFYTALCSIETESGAYTGGHDVLFVGEHMSGSGCLRAVRDGVGKYVASWDGDKLFSSVTHDDIHEDGFLAHVSRTYVVPFRYASRNGNTQDAWALQRDFSRFCRGAGFEDAVLPLCDALTKRGKADLAGAYLHQMEAVKKQNYERAALLRDTISNLSV